MLFVFLFFAGFLGWRAFGYFTAGRSLAAVVAALGSLLFITSLIVSQLPPVRTAEAAEVPAR